MIDISSFPPYCYPINYTIDREKLNNSVAILLDRLGIVYQADSHFAVNLTHLPGLTGKTRWDGYSAPHNILKKIGVDETDFVEFLSEIEDLYVGEVIKDIYAQHPGVFQGRCQLNCIGAGRSLPPHRDYHTKSRYHVVVNTNEKCYWMLSDGREEYRLHMAADEKVWFLDPIGIEHAFYNDSDTYRVHLILTSGKD
jgi:hypothetical protein